MDTQETAVVTQPVAKQRLELPPDYRTVVNLIDELYQKIISGKRRWTRSA